jgi:hypothetical protein
LQRFLREARTAAQVRHAHVCPIYDVGEQGGTPFVVMAYVEGPSLAQHLAQVGRFDDPRRAVKLIAQVAEGLATVHDHGIIHRDLKPGNILLDPDGEPLLTDFGLARPVAPEAAPLTRDGGILGTPAYMAPEQAGGDTARFGPPMDVYSLGVVLYELVTGRKPYTGQTLALLLMQILQEPPPPPSTVVAGLDRSLEAIILKALAKDPAQRYPTARAFAAALNAWLGAAPSAPPATGRHRRAWEVAGIAAVLLVSLGLGFWWGGQMPVVTGSAGQPLASVTAPAATLPLDGELAVLVYSDPAKGPRVKDGVRVERDEALPVRNGELIRLEVRLNQPAHVYLVWLTSEGKAQPLYPWDVAHGFTAEPPATSARTVVTSPPEPGRGWPMVGPTGLETALLLVRPTPLGSSAVLAALLGEVPPGRLLDPKEKAWLELKPGAATPVQQKALRRGLDLTQSRAVDQPLLDLVGRLRPQFELVKAVRFAHVADNP